MDESTVFRIKYDALFALLTRAYEEGNLGYLDLKESVAERLLDESDLKTEPVYGITAEQPVPPMEGGGFVPSGFTSGIYTGHPTGTGIQVTPPSLDIRISSDHTLTMTDNEIFVPNRNEGIRIDGNVDDSTYRLNLTGNLSEAI